MDERLEEIETLMLEKLKREKEVQIRKDREAEQIRARKEKLQAIEAEKIRRMIEARALKEQVERKKADIISEEIRLAQTSVYESQLSNKDKYEQTVEKYKHSRDRIKKQYASDRDIIVSILQEVQKTVILQLEALQSILNAEAAIAVARNEGEKRIRTRESRDGPVLKHLLDTASSVEDTMKKLRKSVDENNYPEMTTLTAMLNRVLGQLIESAGRAAAGSDYGSGRNGVRGLARIAIEEQMSKVSMKGLSEIKFLSYGGTRKKIKNKRSKSNKK